MIHSRTFRAVLPRVVAFSLLLLILVEGVIVHAIPRNDLKDINRGSPAYRSDGSDACSPSGGGGGSDPGDPSNPPSGGDTYDGNPFHTIAYPPITDEQAAIGAINKFIADYKGDTVTPFDGLGEAFIIGAKRSNINPYLAVGHLLHENGFATAPDGWHKTTPPSHNAFGRSATESQPHVYYYGSRRRTVYRWDSWRNSLDDGESGDDWFRYVRRLYIDGKNISPGDFATYISAYAPKSDGNNEALYIQKLLETIDQLVALSNDPNASDWVITGPPTDGSCSNDDSGGGSGNNSNVVEIAKAELGVEQGSDRMLEFTDGNNEEWCADYVSWVFKQAGKPFSGGSSGGWRISSVANMRAYFRNGTDGSKYFDAPGENPQVGDVAFWNPAVYSHVGIVVAVNDDKFTVISGNWGNKVALHPEMTNDGSTINGFGRK